MGSGNIVNVDAFAPTSRWRFGDTLPALSPWFGNVEFVLPTSGQRGYWTAQAVFLDPTRTPSWWVSQPCQIDML